MGLARRLYLDSNTMTPLLQRMANLGWVERVKGEDDGRETFVSLTERGKEIQEKLKDIPSCMVSRLFENEEEFVRFRDLTAELDVMIERLSKLRAKEKEEALEKIRERHLATKPRKRGRPRLKR